MELANTAPRPTIIGVGGFTSEVGKTSLLCDLLRAFPGWEAIKTTRGHYRSCGKDPQACCVSHLLEDQPVIRSGRELTYAPGKDTGRYWDAGATNVHWLIATDAQIASGIEQAIARVQASGVFVEGNSFTEFINSDLFLMVTRAKKLAIKATARRALRRVSAFYLSDEIEINGKQTLDTFLAKLDAEKLTGSGRDVPVFTRNELPKVISRIQKITLPTASEGRRSCLAVAE